MADFVGDLIAAASDLVHELRCATGTVLTIIGSKLEADERARVDECGPQWLTEFEEQRDSLGAREPVRLPANLDTPTGIAALLRHHGVPVEFEEQRDSPEANPMAAPSHKSTWDPERNLAGTCGYQHQDSAVAAADPSPTDSFTVPRAVGDEGSGGDSDILPSPPPEQPTGPAWIATQPPTPWNLDGYDFIQCDSPECGVTWGFGADRAELEQLRDKHNASAHLRPAPLVVAGESPGEVDEQPSLGEPNPKLGVRCPFCPAQFLGPDEAVVTSAYNFHLSSHGMGWESLKQPVRDLEDSELLLIAANHLEDHGRDIHDVVRADDVFKLATELRDRAAQLVVLEREAAGE